MMIATPIPVMPERSALAEPPLRLHRFTVEEYQQLVNAGVIDENSDVELLDGWVVDKMPKKDRHIFANEVMGDILRAAFPGSYRVFNQNPVVLNASVPEPDVMVGKGDIFSYIGRSPQADDLVLVVEISDTTLRQDRTVKQRIYADAGIPFYWILNLVDDMTEVYANPQGSGDDARYEQITAYAPNQPVPLVVDGVEIARVDLSPCFRK